MPPTLTESQVHALAIGDRVRDQDGYWCVIDSLSEPMRSGGNDLVRFMSSKAPYGGYGDTIGTHTDAARIQPAHREEAT